VLILSHIEQNQAATGYDLRFRYNQTAQNSAVSGVAPAVFYCPENPLSGDRTNNRDSAGFGTVDYVPLAYTQLDPSGNFVAGSAWPSAMTGKQYPTPAYYANYGTDGAGFVSASKTWQLVSNVVGAPDAPVSAQFGETKITDITDGSSVSILFVEATGQNEKMLLAGYSNGANANAHIDPTTGAASMHWRWANPDIATHSVRRINSAKNATYTAADATEGCSWAVPHCGPNSEIFSFHGNGAHVVFADGHVVFVKESTSKAVLRALITRSDGKNETAPENFE
jgi:prepilin-type processing-associated H-X9-DG protein